MVVFVTSEWVDAHLDAPGVRVLDPRRSTQYLQGHLKNAVNLPLGKAFDPEGRLRSVDDLAVWIGRAGLDERTTPLLYDAHDGRNAAMLAWLLEYLGRDDVRVMDIFLERWVAEGRALFYRPVRPAPAAFSPRVAPDVRATLGDVRAGRAGKLADFRSRDEYTGRLGPPMRPVLAQSTPAQPAPAPQGRGEQARGPIPPEGEGQAGSSAGHIPGSVNIDWQELLGEDHRFLAPRETLQRLVDEAGITRADRVVAYCQTGPRAAVGYLALRILGFDVRLYDGSYAEWIREGLPVETTK